MAIAIRGAATETSWATGAATRSPACNFPANVAAGDILFAFFTTNTAHNASDVASGAWSWVKLQEVDDTGTDSTSSLLWAIAPTNPGSSFTFTNVFAATEFGHCVIIAYSGNYSSGSIGGSSGVERTVSAAAAATSTAVAPTQPNCMHVQFIGCDPGTGAYTGTADASPTGVERFDLKSSQADSAAYTYIQEYQQTTAASLALDATMATADEYQIIQVAFYEAYAAPICTASAAVLVPTIGITVSISAPVATASAAVKITAGTISEHLYQPSIAAATAGVLTHTIGTAGSTPVELNPSVATASASALVPTTAAKVGLAPGIATATGSALVPTVSAKVGLAPTVAASAGAALVSAVSAQVSLAPTIATASGAALVPTTSSKVELAPAIAAAAGSVLVPTVASKVSLEPGIATATGSAPVPTVASKVGLTPTPISASASIPTHDVSTGASVTPISLSVDTLAAATGAVLAPTVDSKVGLAPSIATAAGAVLGPTVAAKVGLAPSIATASGAVLVPTVSAKVGLAPAAAVAAGTVLTPTTSAPVSLTPSVATAAAPISTHALVGGAINISAPVIGATAGVVAPTGSIAIVVRPGEPARASASILPHTVGIAYSIGININAPTATATASIPQSGAYVAIEILPDPATASAPARTHTLGGAVSISQPAPITAAAAVKAHTVQAGVAVSLSVDTRAAASAAVLTPTISAAVILSATCATAAAAVPEHTTFAATGINLAPSVATAAANVGQHTVIAGGEVSLLAPVIQATASILTPDFAVAIEIAPTPASAYASATFPSGAKARWTLDEQSGTRYDSIGKFHLGDTGSVGYVSDGRFGNAADINSNKLTRADEAGMDMGVSGNGASWSAWFRKSSLPVGDGAWIFGSNASLPAFNLYVNLPGSIEAQVRGSNGALMMATATGSVCDGVWHHVVATFNSSARSTSIYLDGVYRGGSASIAVSTLKSGLGLNIGGGVNSEYFQGQIDEASMWDRALSATEVADLFAGSVGPTVSSSITLNAQTATASASVPTHQAAVGGGIAINIGVPVIRANAAVLIPTVRAVVPAELSGWIACTATMTGRLWVGGDQRLKLTKLLMYL